MRRRVGARPGDDAPTTAWRRRVVWTHRRRARKTRTYVENGSLLTHSGVSEAREAREASAGGMTGARYERAYGVISLTQRRAVAHGAIVWVNRGGRPPSVSVP